MITLTDILCASVGPAQTLRSHCRAVAEAIPHDAADNNVDAYRATAAGYALQAALELLPGDIDAAMALFAEVKAWADSMVPPPSDEVLVALHGSTDHARMLRTQAALSVEGIPSGADRAAYSVARWRSEARRAVCMYARMVTDEAMGEFEAFELYNAALSWALASSARHGAREGQTDGR